jgi:ribosomal protein L29
MVEKENASQESREKRMADIEAQIASLKQELDNLKAQDSKDNPEKAD